MIRYVASAIEKSVALVMAGIAIGALTTWFVVWWMLGPKQKKGIRR